MAIKVSFLIFSIMYNTNKTNPLDIILNIELSQVSKINGMYAIVFSCY